MGLNGQFPRLVRQQAVITHPFMFHIEPVGVAEIHYEVVTQRENQRISMRIGLEVLNSVDHIITTCTSDSECVSVIERIRESA